MSTGKPYGPNPGPHTVILDSLAQSGKRPEFRPESTVQYVVTRLQKRAGRKHFSRPYHIRLAELRNEREQYYRNAVYCAETLVQEPDGRIRTTYCNGRLCPVCQAIRTAKAMNKYMPLIEGFTDPHLLTLTRQTVRERELRETVGRMCEEFGLSSRTLAKQKIRLHGLRKLEIACNCESGRFHPHFHCILEGEEIAQGMLAQWLKRHPGTARPEGQELQRITCGDMPALKLLFGYVTKLVTTVENEQVPVPTESLDAVVAALFGRRTLQPYGGLRGNGCNEEGLITPEPFGYVSPFAVHVGERVFWEWEQQARMWIDRQTGALLADNIENERASVSHRIILPEGTRIDERKKEPMQPHPPVSQLIRNKKMECQANRRNGERCKGHAMAGSDFCFTHNPNMTDRRNAARKKGGSQGKARTLTADAPPVPLASPNDVESLLAETINQTRRGELDAKTANTIGYLSGVLLKAMEYGRLADEIAELKQLVEEKER